MEHPGQAPQEERCHTGACQREKSLSKMHSRTPAALLWPLSPGPGGGVGAELEIQDNRVRVIRGGSCNYLPKNVGSGRRNGYLPANRNYHVGFRPARAVFTE